MQKTKVICTSSCGLSKAEADKLGIGFIPIIVEFDNKEYIEGVDISSSDFFSLLSDKTIDKTNIPKTRMPDTSVIVSLFEEAIEEGYQDILVVAISSGLGGTYNKISIIAEDYKDMATIKVFDSRTTGFHEQYLVKTAKELSEKNIGSADIFDVLTKIRENCYLFGACADLSFLIYNGRLRGAAALLGRSLKVCPSLEMNEEGQIVSFAKSLQSFRALFLAGQRVKSLVGSGDYLLWRLRTGKELLPQMLKIEQKLGFAPNTKEDIMSLCAGVHAGPQLGGWGIIKLEKS